MSAPKVSPDIRLLLVVVPLIALIPCKLINRDKRERAYELCESLVQRTEVEVTLAGVSKPEVFTDAELRILLECSKMPALNSRANRGLERQLRAIAGLTPPMTPPPPPEPTPTDENLARKWRSEQRLKQEKVPVNRNLPAIETAEQVTIRSQDAVVARAVALTIVALKGEGLVQHDVVLAVRRFSAASHFSPKERAFIREPEPTRSEHIQFSWRYEAAGVMLWALGFDEELPTPDQVVDAAHVAGIPAKLGPAKFRKQARLRSVDELLDAADRFYRYNWACVDARLTNVTLHAIDCQVVVERHHALNWLIGYLGQAWDDVTTDT